MANNIVTLNVTQNVAPAASTLQQTGAFISQGGTTLSASSYQALTAASSLAAILPAALAITSITWSANVATVTTAAAIGRATSDTFMTTIIGANQPG